MHTYITSTSEMVVYKYGINQSNYKAFRLWIFKLCTSLQKKHVLRFEWLILTVSEEHAVSFLAHLICLCLQICYALNK